MMPYDLDVPGASNKTVFGMMASAVIVAYPFAGS
jgi:hypothetical protein